MEVLHKLRMWSSYSHMNAILNRLGGFLEKQCMEDTALQAIMQILNSLNKMVEVRDGSSVLHAYQTMGPQVML